jgi:hypothetical protein
MTITGQAASARPLRWDLWWRWALISLIGIIVGSMLEQALPDALRYPRDDENIWLAQPWRVAVLTCVYYTPISLAQWLVLRRYVRRAWWWLLITLGSVAVVYPVSIWVLWNLAHVFGRSGLEVPGLILLEFAWAVWFLGLGGGSIYLVTQWVALLRWTTSIRIWGIWFGITSLGWLFVLRLIALFSSDLAANAASDGGFLDQLYMIAAPGLYQLTLGGVLATIFQPDSLSEMPQTTRG